MGDKIGKEAIKTGKSIQELVIEKELLTEEELENILSPENLMNPKYTATLHKK
jgi:aspartate ammonia-lyase